MSKKSGVLQNLIWKFAERISAQLVTVLVSIILARLLSPSDYGTVALVTIFITFANVFVSDGFGSALIQKKNADALDFSTVLYFNVALSVLLYLILFFTAPLISSFFGAGYEILIPAIRILGIRLLFSAVNSVQQAYISKKMAFRKFFVATLTGTIISAFIGIWMAYNGFGVWALIAQYLVNTSVNTIVLIFVLRKKPLLQFSITRLKQLVGFGFRILGINLLIVGDQEFRAILIGKYYTSNDLAFYNKGAQFPELLTTNINSSISAVLFPHFSELQDDLIQLKATAKKSIRFGFYVVAPFLFGLAAVANNFVDVLLTDRWSGCVPFIWLFCLNRLFLTLHSTNMQLLKALGKGKTFIRLECFKKCIELIVLLSVFRLGVIWIAVSMAITSTVFTYVNCIPTKKNIGYSFKEQLSDIASPLGMCMIMAIIVTLLGYINVQKILLLILQVIIGAIVYIGLSALTKNKEFYEIKDLIKKNLRNLTKKTGK